MISGTLGLGFQFVTINDMIVKPIVLSQSMVSFSQKTTNAQSYTPYTPILITSNTQFASQGLPGSGTQDDPFRIEGLNITASASELIRVQDTTAHVLIRNNVLDGVALASSGISLANVHNLEIKDNFIVNTTDTGLAIESSSNIKSVNNVINYNQDGIKVSNVSDIVILSNTIFSNMRFGIVFINSNDCLISSNYVYDNLFNGVHLRDTQTTTINRNTIFNHWHNDLSQSGILLDNSSNTHVANNSIFNNHYGINFLNSADNNMITNNTVLDNQEYGLRLEYASDNTIIYNNISDNGLYGILITSGADGNLIQFNAFVGNYGGETQATDDGVSNKFSGNYWDDWSNPDLDEDLIVDNPYPIDGTANNSDPYPLVEFSMEAIENVKTNPNFVGILLFMLTVLTLFGGSTGAGYFVYRTRLKPRDVDSEFEPEEPFSEFVSEELIERVKPLYHKLVVGLENIQTSALPQPITVPLLEPAEPITLIEYFPSDIKEDLRSRIKWRTVLTLIEIAYQDPSETNVINLAKSMDIPTSTLSKEIKRLINLHYIEFFVTAKVLQDARYRTYVITPKGFKLLYILKEAFKLAITRIKEKRGDFYI